jgi:DnaJ like chaperone protein
MSIWGKIIGGTAGFALGGPIGAIIGMMVGGSFDRTAKRFSHKKKINPKQKQNIFALSIIILSAKISKADGHVSKDEIFAFKEKFKIPNEEMSDVGRIFNEAKKSTEGFEQIANQVGLLFNDNKILLEELLNNLFYIAESDGNTSVKEIEILKSISNSFGLSETDFQRILHSRLNNRDSDPYKVLGVSRDNNDSFIRKKWIQLNKEHHPDNLIAKGLPQEFIDQANNELSAINIAYDKIKNQRGIN